jgi:hypothetical protein
VSVTATAATLFFQFGSGFTDAVAAANVTLPVVNGLNVTVNVAVALDASEAIFHVAMFTTHVAPVLVDTRDSWEGSVIAATTDCAVAGPALRTVNVHVPETPTFTEVGQASVAARSALFEAGGGVVTATVNGPAFTLVTLFVAITVYLNDVVPVGGVPLNTPLVVSIVSHAGAAVNEYVGAGVPLASNV